MRDVGLIVTSSMFLIHVETRNDAISKILPTIAARLRATA